MLKSLALIAVVAVAYVQAQTAGDWGQCGGEYYTGPTTCPSGWSCVYSNPYYSQCLQGSNGVTTTSTSSTHTTSTSSTHSSTSSTHSTTSSTHSTTSTTRTVPSSTSTTSTTSSSTSTSTSSSTTAAPSACSSIASQAGYPTLTSQYATETLSNGYILENNYWGISAGSGSQEGGVIGVSGDSVAWWTSYTWSGGQNSVKTYTNIYLNSNLGASLEAITSIPTTWSWTYTSAGSGLQADVSYDMWLSATDSPGTGASKTSTYEIMVWLSARGGVQPAGSQVGTATINGLTWQVWKGDVSNWVDFSFVPPEELPSFSEDLLPFFEYLVNNQGVPANSYLVQLQSGTEAFDGTAYLTTNCYSVAINT